MSSKFYYSLVKDVPPNKKVAPFGLRTDDNTSINQIRLYLETELAHQKRALSTKINSKITYWLYQDVVNLSPDEWVIVWDTQPDYNEWGPVSL